MGIVRARALVATSTVTTLIVIYMLAQYRTINQNGSGANNAEDLGFLNFFQ